MQSLPLTSYLLSTKYLTFISSAWRLSLRLCLCLTAKVLSQMRLCNAVPMAQSSNTDHGDLGTFGFHGEGIGAGVQREQRMRED